MILPMRRAALPLLLVFALSGQPLHLLEHPSVESCPGHLDGAHIGGVVKPAAVCPIGAMAGTAVPFLFLAAFFTILGVMPALRPLQLCGQPLFFLRSRAPPR